MPSGASPALLHMVKSLPFRSSLVNPGCPPAPQPLQAAESKEWGGEWKGFVLPRTVCFSPLTKEGGELGHGGTGACEEPVCLAKGLLDELL